MHGFDAGDTPLASPPVQVAEPTREQLKRVLSAIAGGATPEEITEFLTDGFPADVEEMLARPLEGEEMSAHVDLVLSVLQSTVPAVG